MTGQGLPSFDILVVDDDPADVTLAKRALKGTRFPCRVHVAADGVEAMAFLRHEPPYADVPRPDLVLLDLNMPRMDGREVLKEIMADTALRTIIVVVMSTSEADCDIKQSYYMGARSYITKAFDIDDFVRIVRGLSEYWFGIVTIPR